jgi:hypothetical protein
MSARPRGRLVVIEERERVLVSWEDDPADWLCAFAKEPGFAARRWAEDMARAYNARVALSRASSRRSVAASGVCGGNCASVDATGHGS